MDLSITQTVAQVLRTAERPLTVDEILARVRALHGKGLCVWRLGQRSAARQVFATMRRLNPHDNQGVRFLMRDLDAGLTWEESKVREESTWDGHAVNRRPV